MSNVPSIPAGHPAGDVDITVNIHEEPAQRSLEDIENQFEETARAAKRAADATVSGAARSSAAIQGQTARLQAQEQQVEELRREYDRLNRAMPSTAQALESSLLSIHRNISTENRTLLAASAREADAIRRQFQANQRDEQERARVSQRLRDRLERTEDRRLRKEQEQLRESRRLLDEKDRAARRISEAFRRSLQGIVGINREIGRGATLIIILASAAQIARVAIGAWNIALGLVATTAASIAAFFTASYINRIQDMAAAIGITANQAQRLVAQNRQIGLTVEENQSALDSFQQVFERAVDQPTSQAAIGLRLIGVEIEQADLRGERFIQTIASIQDRLRALSSAQQQDVLRALGIQDPGTIQRFLSGDIRASNQQQITESKQAIEAIKEMRAAIGDLFNTLYQRMLAFAIHNQDAIQRVISEMTLFLVPVVDFMENLFHGFEQRLPEILRVLRRAAEEVVEAIRNIGSWIQTITDLIGGFTGAQTLSQYVDVLFTSGILLAVTSVVGVLLRIGASVAALGGGGFVGGGIAILTLVTLITTLQSTVQITEGRFKALPDKMQKVIDEMNAALDRMKDQVTQVAQVQDIPAEVDRVQKQREELEKKYFENYNALREAENELTTINTAKWRGVIGSITDIFTDLYGWIYFPGEANVFSGMNRYELETEIQFRRKQFELLEEQLKTLEDYQKALNAQTAAGEEEKAADATRRFTEALSEATTTIRQQRDQLVQALEQDLQAIQERLRPQTFEEVAERVGLSTNELEGQVNLVLDLASRLSTRTLSEVQALQGELTALEAQFKAATTTEDRAAAQQRLDELNERIQTTGIEAGFTTQEIETLIRATERLGVPLARLVQLFDEYTQRLADEEERRRRLRQEVEDRAAQVEADFRAAETQRYEDAQARLQAQLDQWVFQLQNFTRQMSYAVADFVLGTNTFIDMLRSLAREIIGATLQTLIFQPLGARVAAAGFNALHNTNLSPTGSTQGTGIQPVTVTPAGAGKPTLIIQNNIRIPGDASPQAIAQTRAAARQGTIEGWNEAARSPAGRIAIQDANARAR